MKVLFVEPPKDFWFVMGEYIPQPLGILELVAYLETKNKTIAIDVLDCQAERASWIEDDNWANYDMVHATMPTEKFTREEVQEELYECYRSFYGSAKRCFKSLFSSNALKRRTFRYLASQGLLKGLRNLF